MALNQAYLFLIFVIDGLLIGLLFDVFRIMRISFKTKDIITYFEDILFWILTGIIVLYSIFIFNNGEIRFFILLGIVIGIMLYISLFSSIIIKWSVNIIKYVKRILSIIFNPITFITIKFKKIITKIIRIIQLKKHDKKMQNS